MSESETHPDVDSSVRLASNARRSLKLANLIAAEVPEAREEIVRHLRAAWTDVHQLQTGADEDPRAADFAAELLPADALAAFRQSVATLLDPDTATDLTLADLRQHARWLTLALTPIEARVRTQAGLPHPARGAALTLLAGIGIVGAVVGGAFIWQRVATDPPPWRLTLYAEQDFDGRAISRMHERIDFRWGNGRPTFRVPNDHFSARADTCLTIDEPTTLEFFLLSDDGSRLYLDGRQVVDNWGVHGERTVSKRFKLEPGTHHLLVEFFDNTQNARLKFGIDDAEGVPAPSSMLSPPTGAADSAAPCGAE